MKNVKGILFCGIIGIVAYFCGNYIPVVGGPVFGMIFGILLALILKKRADLDSGIAFTSKKILQYAVILLGFGLNLKVVVQVGAVSLPVILSTISCSLIVSYLMSRVVDLDKKIVILIGVGSSICGGSAIAATAPVIEAKDDEIAQSISVVFLFNLIAALIFPTIGDILGFSNEGFALFAGTAINDTSSVTAAASVWDSVHGTNGAVLDSATIVKLTRTLAIIPITTVLAIMMNKNKNNDKSELSIKKILPMFVLYFILASLITTVLEILIGQNIFSKEIVDLIHSFFKSMKHLSKFFIVMAMTAIGLNTNLDKLIKSGKNSILLGGTCWIGIILVSIGVQKIIGIF